MRVEPALLAFSGLWAAAAAACSRDTTALTSDCSSLCYDGRPCVAFAAGAACNATTFGTCESAANSSSSSGSGGDECAFECFTNGPDDFAVNGAIDFTTYEFFIPFGASESKWEANWTSSQASNVDAQLTEDDTDERPSESNDVVANIEVLSFQPTTTSVYVHALSLLKASLSVTLANLGFDADPPQSTFPTELESFRMSNCLLSTYPADLPSMTSLLHLDLSQNYFKDYPVKFALSQLLSLNMSTNSLTSFVGRFPNLTSLDLSGNTLAEIPSSVFAMTNLKALDLTDNSFADVTLSASQLTFLQSLESFTIDSFGDATCDATAQSTVGGATVCTAATGSSNGSGGSSGSSNTAAIIGGVVGAIAVVIVLGIAFLCYRRRKAGGRSSKGTGTTTTNQHPSMQSSESRSTLSLWNDQELLSLQMNADDLEDVRKLGTGAYGVVYLAKYRQNKLVACKRLKRDDATYQNTQHFIAEIKLVAKLSHPRVVALLGVAWTIESDLQAVFEYMAKGDLRTHLESSRGPTGWNWEKLQLAADIVEALVYVHSFSPPLVHRDLKSRNVLLSEDLRGHLSDFGVARFRSDVNTMTTGVGTGRWLAPEVISGSSDYDQTSDLFAFGVVLSELDTHALPYEDARGSSGNRLADVAILQLVAAGRLLPSFRPQCPPELRELAMRCMSFERTMRPSAVEVAFALRTLQKTGQFN
ncbi:hypothetical protein BBJ28_00019816 [Nothophytophthora sp. Chile5]|nr:hypothetical protein BBJ28_00019816 [Nothophytophthora sp. Chile5]